MGIVWFFLWIVVHISGNGYINAAEKAKEKQSDCQISLVANSHQPNPSGSSGTSTALDPQDFAKASQWRRNIPEEDQRSSQNNHGDGQRTAMALSSVLEARQGESAVLPQLRRMVGISSRQQRRIAIWGVLQRLHILSVCSTCMVAAPLSGQELAEHP